MRKISKLTILTLGAIASACLASCGPDASDSSDHSSVQQTLTSIKIVSGSIKTSFSQGATPNYNNLAINLLDQDEKKMDTLKWVDNKDKITFTEIDTSELATDKVFTVTYNDGQNEFTDTLKYNVVEAYTLSSWAANPNYSYTTGYQANNKISTDEDNLEKGFMKTATFYVGNMNSVNLLPELNGLNKETYEVTELTSIPTGATVKLVSEGQDLVVDSYIENADSFIKDGQLKFKDGVTGSFAITLSYSGLQDIVYNVEVVDAYNVSKATDLYAFYTNNTNDSSIFTPVHEFKKELGLPDADNIVIQNDITIGKNDIPSAFIWQENCDEVVKGSLKDWIRLYEHQFDDANETATVYGNLHKISFNTDEDDENMFPYVITDSQEGIAQSESKPISCHASLFYGTYGANQDPFNCQIIFKDLQASGNNGVDDTATTAKKVGPMFLKSEVNSKFDNVLVNSFYMAAMADGPYSWYENGVKKYGKQIDGVFIDPKIEIDSCRFNDSANAALYFFGQSKGDIKNSDITKAGGPLIFTNPQIEPLPDDVISALSYAPTFSTEVNIDENSFLSNYTAGKGGWFDAYSASAIAGNLQSMDGLFTPYGMSFLRTKNDVKKFNLILVNLPISGEEALALPSLDEGCTNVTIKKGNNVVYSTLDGYQEVMTAYAALATATQSAASAEELATLYQAYADAISSSFYGNNLAYADIKNEMVFAATNGEGKHEFGIVNVDQSSGQYYLCSSDYAIKAGMAAASIPVTVPSSYQPGETMKSAGFLSATINGNIVYGSSQLTTPTAYNGANNYGVILGDYHAI